jgi:hypothetical protein
MCLVWGLPLFKRIGKGEFMPALTATNRQFYSLGNKIGVIGTFAAIANADTWATGLQTVESVDITNGQSGQTFGATYSGGVVTFAASAGLVNARVRAVGT